MNLNYIIILILLWIIPTSLIFSQNSDEVILPVKKGHSCKFYSSRTGKKLAQFLCEDVGKWDRHLIPVKVDGKWGYKGKSGEWIILPEYEFADNFYHHLARVQMNQRFGFINSHGKVVIPFLFTYVGNFRDSIELAPFQCGKKTSYLYGYINIKGKIVIPCKYQEAHEFRNGIAKVRNFDLYGFISFDSIKKKEKMQFPFRYPLAGDFGQSLVYIFTEDGFRIIKMNGKEKFRLNSSYIPENFSLTDPLMLFQDLSSGWYGYIDISGKIVIPPIFLMGEEFYLGYTKVIGPKSYQNFEYIDIRSLWNLYQNEDYTEFYIDTSGKRITFSD